MSKREKLRLQRQQREKRNRLLAIILGSAGGLLVVFLLVLPYLKPVDVGTIVQITPAKRNIAANHTSLGDPAAPVKLDVWEDFQCPACRSFSENTAPQLVQDYVATGKVYYTFHVYPFIDGGSGESHQAANAALCAGAQNRFWDYHDMLFANWTGENVGSFTDARLVAFAQNLGLDMAAFNQCFAANTYAAQIQADFDRGKQLGVHSTPTIFVNEQQVVSSAGANYIPSVDDIAKSIEAALSAK